jgi:hypothetical protein
VRFGPKARRQLRYREDCAHQYEPSVLQNTVDKASMKKYVATFKAGLSAAYRKQELREQSCLRITRQGTLGRSNLPKVKGHDRTDPLGEGNQHWRKPAYSQLMYECSVRNSAESYAVHRTEVRDQASHPNGIEKVIDIWKMAGNAMLLMIPELEMRAADCAAFAVTLIAAAVSSVSLRVSSPACLLSIFTADTIQRPFAAARRPTSTATATGMSSCSDSGHSWHVEPAVKNPSTQAAQPFPPVPVWHSPLAQREPAEHKSVSEKSVPLQKSNLNGHERARTHAVGT